MDTSINKNQHPKVTLATSRFEIGFLRKKNQIRHTSHNSPCHLPNPNSNPFPSLLHSSSSLHLAFYTVKSQPLCKTTAWPLSPPLSLRDQPAVSPLLVRRLPIMAWSIQQFNHINHQQSWYYCHSTWISLITPKRWHCWRSPFLTFNPVRLIEWRNWCWFNLCKLGQHDFSQSLPMQQPCRHLETNVVIFHIDLLMIVRSQLIRDNWFNQQTSNSHLISLCFPSHTRKPTLRPPTTVIKSSKQ